MSPKSTISPVIKNRGFLNLWINQILVQLSSNALNFTLVIWVFQLTSSNTAVSVLLLACYLPAVILGLFTGVLVDLIDRRKIIIIINFFLCLALFSLIPAKGNFPIILVLAFVINTLGQFYAQAEASAIPLVVKKSQLITANSLFSTTFYSSFILGFGLAGPLINHFGIDSIFAIGGGILVLAFLLSLMLPSVTSKHDKEGKRLLKAISKRNYSEIQIIGIMEIIKTLRLIKGKLSVLTSIVILAGVQMVVAISAVLVPGFLETSLHIKATDASYILIVPLGIGIITGGWILGRMGQRLIKRLVVSKAIVFAGLLFFLVGISPVISPAIKYLAKPKPLHFLTQPSLSGVSIVGSFLLGLALVSILVPTQTVIQQNTPESIRGKVFSVLGAAMSGLSLIPVFLAGILADIFGVTPILIGLGVLIILAGLFGLKPSLFFKEEQLSYNIREFLGLGHWERK